MTEQQKQIYDKIVIELKKHDFYHEKSDDHRDWLAGNAHKMHIIKLMKQIPVNAVGQLVKDYVPLDEQEEWTMSLTINLFCI